MPNQCPNPACGAPAVTTVLQCQKSYKLEGTEKVFGFRFAYCRVCRLGFVVPQPSARVLASFYPSDYAYWAAPPLRLSLATRIKYLLASWRHQRFLGNSPLTLPKAFIASLAEIAAGRDASFSLGIPVGLPRNSRILDFGFGGGGFLLALRALGYTGLWGYDVEPNRHTQQHLQSVGIQAFCGDEFLRLPDGFFDCIRLEHVLEHLATPIDTLSRLREMLRPGGVLVLTVPSIHAWEPIERLASSPELDHLQLPIHLWHHSSQSIQDFLTEAKLEVVDVRCLRPFSYLSALARNRAR